MNRKVAEMRKSIWKSGASGEWGELWVAPNGNHAMVIRGDEVSFWDWDLRGGETVEQFKKRNSESAKKTDFGAWFESEKTKAKGEKNG